jgi:hypothetical protein
MALLERAEIGGGTVSPEILLPSHRTRRCLSAAHPATMPVRGPRSNSLSIRQDQLGRGSRPYSCILRYSVERPMFNRFATSVMWPR